MSAFISHTASDDNNKVNNFLMRNSKVESGDAFTCDADSDVNKDAPICIGMDYNANINWLVAYDI